MNEQVIAQFPLSNSQRLYWGSNFRGYCYCQAIVNGILDKSNLLKSVQKVVLRHSILRTTYVMLPDFELPVQNIDEDASFTFLDHTDTDITKTAITESVEQVKTALVGFKPDAGKPLFISLHGCGENAQLLTIALPAIATDSLSLQNIAREILISCSNSEDNNDNENIQYYHFSEWHANLLDVGSEEAESFWGSDAVKVSDISQSAFACRNRGVNNALTDIKNAGFEITAEQLPQLRILAAELDTDLQTILLACYGIMLQQQTRQEKLSVGYINNRRWYDELNDVIGPVAQTLPLLIKGTENDSFQSILANVKADLETLTGFDEYFKSAVTNCKSTYLNYQFEYNTIDPGEDVVNDFSITQLINISSAFDLKLSCLENGNVLRVNFSYNANAFNESAVEIMVNQVTDLAAKIIENNHCPVTELFNASLQELSLMVNVFNSDKCSLPFVNVRDAFEKNARQFPKKIALRYEGIDLTFDELNRIANQFAHFLIANYGVTNGDKIGLLMPRSHHQIIAMLGIIKAGCVYVPVDVTCPVLRVKLMMDRSEAKALVVARELPVATVPQIVYHDSNISLGAYNDANLNVNIKGNDPVYIIYTSGSTGEPKPVLISHEAIFNYAHWFFRKSGSETNWSSLLTSTIAFDVSYTVLWPSLLFGQTLCILKESEYFESAEVISKLIEYQVDYIKITASGLNVIVNDTDFDEKCSEFNLKLIVIGAEPVRTEDVDCFHKTRPGINIMYHYGPTETTVGTIAKLMDFNDFQKFKNKIVLGHPITNSEIYILNDRRNPVPIGFTGEIAIAGKGLASGYFNAPDITESRFIQHPVNDKEKIYLTGDLGRCMPDGSIEFLGRKDSQLKIRGYRIEPGEIESNLKSHPDIKNVIVLAHKNNSGDIQLIAYLLSDQRQTNEHMNTYLSALLPSYMLPDTYIWLAALPLLPNGKVNRRALVQLALEEPSDTSYVAPKTVLEKKMAILWMDILQKARVGLYDDFFKLGGQSLKATQLVSRIFKNFGFRVKLADVFENATIASLIEVFTRTGQIKFEAIPSIGQADAYVVSHAQKRLWFLDQFGENQSAYNVSYSYWLKGNVDIDALNRAFEVVLKRHETLRTNFVVVDGEPKQKISAFSDFRFKLSYEDLTKSVDAVAKAESLAKEYLQYTFALDSEPLIKAGLLQVADNRYAFLLTMHHIISDGWSMRVLMNELMAAYHANCSTVELTDPFDALKLQYKDYAAWHNTIIAGDDEKYWRKKLANTPALVKLPYDKSAASAADINDPYTIVELDAAQVVALRKLAARHNTSLSNIVLTAYSLLINKVSGQYDFLIGVGHANRNHSDLESLIGFFVNLISIRVVLDDDQTIDEIIDGVTKNSIEAYDHSNYPIDLLVEHFCKERYSSRQPLFNVMYDFKSFADLTIDNEGFIDSDVLEITDMPQLKNIAKFDLTLFAAEAGDILRYFFEYDARVFSKATINNFYKIFAGLLQLISAPEPVSQTEQTAMA